MAKLRDDLPVDDAVEELDAETERVCAMAEELGELAWKLTLAPAA
ncbi:MAG TPA: hypothetical protein VK605_03170 [Solirubrobacteraceae bacterium]|nr:hypothetical protein [Solirubrobacteraceae bacterium]